jgi:hypothetical protein
MTQSGLWPRTALAALGGLLCGVAGAFFVPLLAVGDLSGRRFAPVLGVSGSLAGGPLPAVLTCLGVIVVATLTGAIVAVAVDRLASKHAAPSRA